MAENEIWKPIFGYEGFYEVSNLGNVKSLDRLIPCGRRVNGKTLSAGKASNGYLSVVICGLSQSTKMVHALVAEAFLGHKPDGFNKVINHKDFDKLNNSVSNLEIVTNRDNTNAKHLKIGKSSKYTGVTYVKARDRWQATIRVKGKPIYLGRHKDEHKAHLAYEQALKEINSKP